MTGGLERFPFWCSRARVAAGPCAGRGLPKTFPPTTSATGGGRYTETDNAVAFTGVLTGGRHDGRSERACSSDCDESEEPQTSSRLTVHAGGVRFLSRTSMKTEIIRIDPQSSAGDAVFRAAKVLSLGGLVGFPTETVYGVCARADKPDGVVRLRRVKSRDADQAFTVHIASPVDAWRFAPRLEGVASRLMRRAWPGPLTLILPVDDPLSAPVMADLNGSVASTMYHDGTIGLRCPDDPVAAALLKGAGGPVVAASANSARHPPPWTARDALRDLNGRIELLLDAGRTKYAKPSTIVRVSGSSYKLLREGVLDSGVVKRLSTLEILLVCTGNTCRSPMAAALAKRMLAERLGCAVAELRQRGIEVRSAGTAGGGGEASSHAVAVMRRRGIDVTDHVSAALTPQMVRQADYIFVMTRSHRDRVIDMVPSAKDRVALLLGDEDIRDPIGGSEDDYEQCARTVEKGLSARLQEVIV